MKTTATASNGTILEIGKKYYANDFKSKEWIEIIDISLEENEIWAIDSNGIKSSYLIYYNWFRYKETQPNPFEGYQKFFIHLDSNRIKTEYIPFEAAQELKRKSHILGVYTEQEAIELGLKI